MHPCTTESACNAPRDSSGADPFGASAPIVVLGIGNLLWADEGFGVRCVEALMERYEFGPEVALVDGGTQGLALLSLVQSARRLLILDAVDYGRTPGELVCVEGEDVPRFLASHKMSLHQTGFQEVLMLALLGGHYPQSVLLVGCQPEWLDDYGGSLRPVVRAAMAPALDRALAQLRDWGVKPHPRAQPLAQDSPLSLRAYEDGRPDAATACRTGDARFMPAV
jgi:hydrogenase maturation protease